MKKWLKWTLGVIAAIIIVLAIMMARMWNSVQILKGTQGLDGETETIPNPQLTEYSPITKGETDWSNWLGPDGEKHSSVTGILTDWSGGLETVWQVDFLCQGNTSASWSAPVIQGNRLIVCGRNEQQDQIFCLNPDDGSLIWQNEYTTKAISSHGKGPRATPYIDNDRVYTFGRSGVLACYNLLDGNEIWHTEVTNDGGKEPTWGFSSSPLVIDSLVIVQAGGSAGTVAYNKITGDLVWNSGQSVAGYAAITTMKIDNQTVILSFQGKDLSAINPETGNVLWSTPWTTDYDVNATTPLAVDDKVFVSSGYKTGSAVYNVTMSSADTLWFTDELKAMHTDPYLIDGYIYCYSGQSFQNKGAFKCIEFETGKVQWSTNDMGHGTCTWVDSYLVCLDIKGNLFLMQPNPKKFMKITEFPKALGDIKGPVWTMPIIANNKLYVRFKQTLICYEIIES